MFIPLTAMMYYYFLVVESKAECPKVKNKLQCCLSKGFNAPAVKRHAACKRHINDESSDLLSKSEFYKCRLVFKKFKRRCNLPCHDLDGTCVQQNRTDNNRHCWQPMNKISGSEKNRKTMTEIESFNSCEEECIKAGSACEQLEYYPNISECVLSPVRGDLLDQSVNYIVVEMSCYNSKGYPDCEMKGNKITGNSPLSLPLEDPTMCAMACSTSGKAMAFSIKSTETLCDCFKVEYSIEAIAEFGAKKECFG